MTPPHVLRRCYTLHVEEAAEGGYVAQLDPPDSPLRGWGETPLQAVASLCETIREWPIGGSDRWLGTPQGAALAAEFGVALSPKPRGSS